MSDGSRIYFNEDRGGTQVLAEVATTGGEPALVTNNIPGSDLSAYAANPSRLLLRDDDEAAGWLLPLPGGEPRKVIEKASGGLSFAPNGDIAFIHVRNLYLAHGDGSDPHEIFTFPQGCPNSPIVSPDGTKIRASVCRNFLDQEIWEMKVDGKNVHAVVKGWEHRFDSRRGRWTADGKYFILQSRREGRNDLWVLAETGEWLGAKPDPVRLTNGPLSYELPFPSSDGKHLYVIGRKQRGELVRFDRRSQEFIPFLSGISARDVSVSNDGKWVAYASYPDHSLWRSRIDGSDRLQLTYPPTAVIWPHISPDGRQVVYGCVDENRNPAAYAISINGGTPRKIVDNAPLGANWSPDGNSVVALVRSFKNGDLQGTHIETVDLRSGKITSIPDSIQGGPWWPLPNMLLAADCTNNNLHNGNCVIQTFDLTTQKWSDLLETPINHWMPSIDGKYLYFSTGNVNPRAMRIRFSDRQVEDIVSLKGFRAIEDELSGPSWIGVTPDGDPLLTRDIGTDEIYDISLRWH